MGNQKGFSLIESLVGLAVFGLIGIIIMTSLATSARSNMTNSNLTEAESLARAQLEYVQSQTYNGTNNGTVYAPPYLAITLPTGYSFATSVATMVTRINSNGSTVTTDDGLQQITVSIKYATATLFTLTGYKVNR